MEYHQLPAMKMAAKFQLHLLRWICILGILLHIPESRGQRTYLKACECERTKNGQCAYRMVMPGSPDRATCADSNSDNVSCANNAKSIEDLQTSMKNLSRAIEEAKHNLTVLDSSATEANITINELQRNIVEHRQILASLEDNGRGDGNSGGEDTSRLQQMLAQLQRVNKSLGDLQDQVQTLPDFGIQVREISEKLDNVTLQQEDLRQQVLQLSSDIAEVMSDFRGLPTKFGLCSKKGLAVSGEDSYLDDRAISVSSFANSTHGRLAARVDSRRAWCKAGTYEDETNRGGGKGANGREDEPNLEYEWIQFDLGSVRLVLGVVTLGRADYDQWVTGIMLQHSQQPDEGWTTLKNILGGDMVFPGNTDRNSPNTIMLDQPINTQYIRIRPITGYRNLCMRADVIVCLDS